MFALLRPPSFLIFISLALLGPSPGRASEHAGASAASAVMSEADQIAMSPAQAFIRLQEGNARFLSGKRLERDWPAQVHETAHGQHPFASIVSCMDSRTAVEQVFDLGLGDVFSIRLAGNVIDEDVLGSLEYAHKVAGAKLIVVLGHSHCGAMKGAADDVILGNLTNLVARVKPAVAGVAVDGSPRTSKNMKFVDSVGRMHVILSVRMIRERSAVLRELHDRGAIDIIGGFYDIETGKVEFYRPLVGAAAEEVARKEPPKPTKSPAPAAAHPAASSAPAAAAHGPAPAQAAAHH